jgi:hypothetical protein
VSQHDVLAMAFNQRSNQLQKRLMLRMFAVSAEKRADIDIAHLSPGREIGFVPHKRSPCLGLTN